MEWLSFNSQKMKHPLWIHTISHLPILYFDLKLNQILLVVSFVLGKKKVKGKKIKEPAYNFKDNLFSSFDWGIMN